MILLLMGSAFGAGLAGALGWVLYTRQGTRHALAQDSSRRAAEALRQMLDRLQYERVRERQQAILESVTAAPVVPRRYVVQLAPLEPASSPDPAVPDHDRRVGAVRPDVAYLEQLDREVVRCAAVRREFDRDRCFDIQCERCSPRPQDRPTGAMPLIEVA